jgi:molybdate transport system substrate-binding protein
MRERIERGEQADLFASADIGHARTLVEQGRATVMAMFARNSICPLAPEGLGLTEATIVDKLLDPATRIGISTPRSIRSATIPSRFITGSAENMPARQTI